MKTCAFHEYSREKRAMVNCGKPAVKKVGAAYLCEFHAPYVAGLRERTSRTKFNVIDVKEE